MSDQFPALEDAVDTGVSENVNETDFLQREKDLLGDEFKTEADEEVLNESKDAEIQQFEDSYPELDSTPAQASASTEPAELNAEDEFGEFGSAATSNTTEDFATSEKPHEPTEAIKNWKERRDLEIEQRDKQDTEKKSQLEQEAVENINEFYENYAKKKESQMEQSKKEAEEFLKQRDAFFTQEGTTTWDRAIELINIDDAEVVAGRDRSKFKELLLKLKGNEKAPGAGGY
ncbi:hypothetical protein ACO0QE_001751 [Hanseniaspora vineae]